MKIQISSIILLVLAFSFCTTKNSTEAVERNGESLVNTVLNLPDSLTLYKSEFRVLNEKFLTNEANTFLIDQDFAIIKSGNPIKSSSFAKSLFEEGF